MSDAFFQIAEPGESKAKDACAVGRVVGIDLGTTNSLVASVVAGVPRSFPVEAGGDLLLPSVVEYFSDGRVLVGKEAMAHAPERPRDVIVSVKRFMGRGPDDP